MWVDRIPVVCILDDDQHLSDADMVEVRREVRVCIAAGLVSPPPDPDSMSGHVEGERPDPGRGSSGRGTAVRPWAGPGTRGYRPR